jgi:intraflagellar transport protein 88
VSSLGRPTTGLADGPARPMTGIRGAGYPGTAQGRPGANGGLFDPLNQAARAAASSSGGLEKKAEETPEEKIKSLERRVTDLVEESCLAASRRENKMALDRAKEASAKVTRCQGGLCQVTRYQGGLCQGNKVPRRPLPR